MLIRPIQLAFFTYYYFCRKLTTENTAAMWRNIEESSYSKKFSKKLSSILLSTIFPSELLVVPFCEFPPGMEIPEMREWTKQIRITESFQLTGEINKIDGTIVCAHISTKRNYHCIIHSACFPFPMHAVSRLFSIYFW